MRYLFILLLVFQTTITSATEKEIIFAADPWCPYNCEPNSKHPGYLIELAFAVYEPLGYKVIYKKMPWKRALYSAKNGIINAAVGAVIGDVSDNIYGTKSLGRDETVAIVRKGEIFKYKNPTSFDGKILGIITNYTYDNNGVIDKYIEKRGKEEKGSLTKLYHQKSLDSLFQMLILKRIDVFLENKFVALYKAKQLGYLDEVEIVETGAGDTICFAFTPDEQGKKLANLLDNGIIKLRKSGKLKVILSKYGLKDWQ